MKFQRPSIFLVLLTLHQTINSAGGLSQQKILYGSIDRDGVEERNEDFRLPLPSISDSLIEECLKRAEKSIVDEEKLNHHYHKRQAPTNSSSCKHRRVAKPEAFEISRNSEIIARAAELLRTTQNLTRGTSERLVTRATTRPNINLNTLCEARQFRCNSNFKFRLMDGSCNNLQNPQWGMSVHRLNRIIKPQYGDGTNSPRLAKSGRALPLSRFVSTTVIPDISVEDNRLTHVTMFFGQFSDHDITSTPHRSDLTNCCSNQNNPDCLAIRVPRDDPFLSQFRIGCMEFSRSNRACGTGVREQMNQNTAFIDGSQIYGSNDREAANLRSFQGGFLKSTNNGADLPVDNNSGDFLAGDDRLNEHPGLISLHNLFLREHNRIARILRSFGPSFNDETLYQETKRVVIAELENIIYSEYLPVILGPDKMNEFELNLPGGGDSTVHRQNVNPSTINSFATAAYRFGHSLIQNNFKLGRSTFALRDHFNNPTIIRQSGMEPVLLGGVEQPAQTVDNFVATAVTQFLFKEPNSNFGLDLAAFNIERGREHGLPGYNAYRVACDFPRVNSFDDLRTVFRDSRAPGAFREAYEHVDDIDLWPAGVAESHVRGGAVGPTFACILGTQFHRLLYGDRHFFTHASQPGSFTPDERSMLKRRTLASIICDNTNAESIQLDAFLAPSSRNTVTPCSRHPKIDFRIFF